MSREKDCGKCVVSTTVFKSVGTPTHIEDAEIQTSTTTVDPTETSAITDKPIPKKTTTVAAPGTISGISVGRDLTITQHYFL